MSTNLPVHRVQCAAFAARECESVLMWESPSSDPIGTVGERLLIVNGWRLDHGQWICGNHDELTEGEVSEPQAVDYTRRRIGHDLSYRPIDGGRRLDATGWGPDSGRSLREGDYLILANGDRTTRYQVESVSYYCDPPDMWQADLAFAPREEPQPARLPAATA